jgi:predicted nucleic acid-binding protein
VPTSTPTSIRIRRPVPDRGPDRGLIDTSVAIGLGEIDVGLLPAAMAISALTLAELAAGPAAAPAELERARRQERVQRVEASFEAIPFDSACGRAYGRVYAAVVAAGRNARGPRSVDLMIAATALALELPLYTLNAADLRGLDELIEIVDLAQ